MAFFNAARSASACCVIATFCESSSGTAGVEVGSATGSGIGSATGSGIGSTTGSGIDSPTGSDISSIVAKSAVGTSVTGGGGSTAAVGIFMFKGLVFFSVSASITVTCLPKIEI